MFGGGAKPIGGGALAPPGPYGSYGPATPYRPACLGHKLQTVWLAQVHEKRVESSLPQSFANIA